MTSVCPGPLTSSNDLRAAIKQLDAKVRSLEVMPMIRVSRRALAPRDPRLAAKLETLLLTLFPHASFRQDPTSWRDEGTRWQVSTWSLKKQRQVYRQAIHARNQWIRWKTATTDARVALSIPLPTTSERLRRLQQQTDELIADLKRRFDRVTRS